MSDPATPRARQLAEALRGHLTREAFHPGELVGTERDLAERFGVGRTLLRAALGLLENDHLVRRTIGRCGGVHAADARILRRLDTTEGVPSMVRAQGRSLSTRVVGAHLRAADPYEARTLRLASPANVVRITRIRQVDGSPWSLDTSILPAGLFPGLLAYDLSLSLTDLARERYGFVPGGAREEIEVIEAGAGEAALLDVEVGAPLLLICRLTWSEAGQHYELGHDLFRADRTRIGTRRYGTNWKRGAQATRGSLDDAAPEAMSLR